MKDLFILDKVVGELLDIDKSLISPLMKLNYFGLLTKNQELTNYTNNEINGYSYKESEIPDYRYSRPQLLVDIHTAYERQRKEIPISMLKDPFREKFEKTPTLENISVLERMSKEINEPEKGQELIHKLPLEMLPYIQPIAERLYIMGGRINVQSAMLTKSGNTIVSIINNVRTRLLKFVVEISERFGHEISIKEFIKNRDENNKTIQNIMNNYITSNGDGNVINTGDSNDFKIGNLVTKNDIGSLKKALDQIGVPDTEVNEIIEIIQEENPDSERKELGLRSKKWIEKIVNGVGKTVSTISANVLTAYLKSYYDL
jgi:hypothetical protein